VSFPTRVKTKNPASGRLTAARQALAGFLEVDPDVPAGAGMGSPAAGQT